MSQQIVPIFLYNQICHLLYEFVIVLFSPMKIGEAKRKRSVQKLTDSDKSKLVEI